MQSIQETSSGTKRFSKDQSQVGMLAEKNSMSVPHVPINYHIEWLLWR